MLLNQKEPAPLAPQVVLIACPPANAKAREVLKAAGLLHQFRVKARGGGEYIILAASRTDAMATALELASIHDAAPLEVSHVPA